MSQNRNNPRRPRYRKHRRHAKWLQEFLDAMVAKFSGNATETNVSAVDGDFEFAATISGSAGPYKITGVSPAELVGVDQFYIRAFDDGGTDKAEVYTSLDKLGKQESKITFASRSLSVAASGVDTVNDTIGVASHGMSTGAGPFQLTTTTTIPPGLALTTDYFCIYNDPNSFKVSTTLSGALAGSAIDITGAGAGTHSVNFAFTIAQDMTADGIIGYMGRGISRDRMRAGAATASGIAEIFE